MICACVHKRKCMYLSFVSGGKRVPVYVFFNTCYCVACVHICIVKCIFNAEYAHVNMILYNGIQLCAYIINTHIYE